MGAGTHAYSVQLCSIRLFWIQADPDDNKFVDCAFEANATYIVSNDKHFNALKEIDYPKIQVIKLIEFLQTLL